MRRRAPGATSARWRRKLRKIGFGFSVLVIVSPAILVFLWMLSLSLKNEIDNLAYPPVFIPSPPTLAQLRPGVRRKLDGAVFLEQHRRVGLRDADRARRRHARRLRHRARAGAQADRADPDRPHDAGAFVPDPAVHRVPVPRPQQHADRARHHAPGDHRADHRLRHGRLLRDAAARARGSRADRRRQRVDDVPLRRAAAGAAGHRRRRRSSRSSFPGTTSSSAPCWPDARRERCRPPCTTC